MVEPHPHQNLWLWSGGAMTAVASAGVSVSATLYSHQSLWVTPGFVVAYVAGLVALLCVMGAARGWRFPLLRKNRPMPLAGPIELDRPHIGMETYRDSQEAIKGIFAEPQELTGVSIVPVNREIVNAEPGLFWLRLRVTNDGPERHFRAKVVALDGVAPHGPEPEWWIPWRGLRSDSTCLIAGGGGSEMLLLAISDVGGMGAPNHYGPFGSFLFLASEGDPKEEPKRHLAQMAGISRLDDVVKGAVTFTVRLWESGTSRSTSACFRLRFQHETKHFEYLPVLEPC